MVGSQASGNEFFIIKTSGRSKKSDCVQKQAEIGSGKMLFFFECCLFFEIVNKNQRTVNLRRFWINPDPSKPDPLLIRLVFCWKIGQKKHLKMSASFHFFPRFKNNGKAQFMNQQLCAFCSVQFHQCSAANRNRGRFSNLSRTDLPNV